MNNQQVQEPANHHQCEFELVFSFPINLQYLAAQMLAHGGHHQGQISSQGSSQLMVANCELCFPSNLMH